MLDYKATFLHLKRWQSTVTVCGVMFPEAGVLVRKLSQLTRSAKLSGVTPCISTCSVESAVTRRVSPFRKKIFSLLSEIKRIWIRFTCVSLFHYKISLLFFRFFLLIFTSNFSLRFTWVIFTSKRNKAKRNSSLFFRFFSLFFAIFLIFSLLFTFFRFFSL